MSTDQTTDLGAGIRASRFRVPRSRGALSGVLLLLLGAWAAIVPFIGPYLDFAFTPGPNVAWKWTAARAYLEVLPGAAAVLGGALLLVSASRVTTSLGSWLGAAGGAWLIVGPALANPLGIALGRPDPSSGTAVRALEQLFFFSATGAAILFVAGLAFGRLSVHGIRDVRAAQRRAAGEAAANAGDAANAGEAGQAGQAGLAQDTGRPVPPPRTAGAHEAVVEPSLPHAPQHAAPPPRAMR